MDGTIKLDLQLLLLEDKERFILKVIQELLNIFYIKMDNFFIVFLQQTHFGNME